MARFLCRAAIRGNGYRAPGTRLLLPSQAQGGQPIVRFRCRREPLLPGMDIGWTMKVIRAAFQQRQNAAKHPIRPRFGAFPEQALLSLEQAGIDHGRRPQTLDWREFAALSAAIRSVQSKGSTCTADNTPLS